MKPAHIARCLLLGSLGTAVHASEVSPRLANAVQPRQADAVQPRFAAPVQPRNAPAVRSTALEGKPDGWRWQNVGDTGVANEGVARGSQLKNIRCAGMACRVYASTAGEWTIRAEGGFPEAPGRTLDILVMNTQTRQQAERRSRGVFSDGRFWDQVYTGSLPAGSYAVFYNWNEQDKVLAAITFDVQKHASASRIHANSGRASDAHARQQAKDAALQNQRCLAMAATNPDIQCVPRQ